MRKIDDGEKKERKKKKKKKITVEIVATNVVASRPPNGDQLQRRQLVPIILHIFFTLLNREYSLTTFAIMYVHCT